MKVAVFETSEIFDILWNPEEGDEWKKYLGRELVAEFSSDSTFTGAHIYSTGNLERAIAQGYRIYVASTRTSLGAADHWWRALVPIDDIWLARPQYPDDEEDRDASISAGWMAIYQILGIPWPMNKLGEREFWTQAREKLAHRGDIRLGRSFETPVKGAE